MFNTKRNIIALSALAVAAIASPMLASSSAHAYECKSGATVGIGVQTSPGAAHHVAITNWKAQAKAKYGLPWSVWEVSQGKIVQCNKSGNLTQCQAISKACKYVVF